MLPDLLMAQPFPMSICDSVVTISRVNKTLLSHQNQTTTTTTTTKRKKEKKRSLPKKSDMGALAESGAPPGSLGPSLPGFWGMLSPG